MSIINCLLLLLRNSLEEEWADIPQEDIQNLIGGMNQRFVAGIRARGGNIRKRRVLTMKENGILSYRSVPPNGGWGYVIVAATTIVFIATVVPLGAFGIVYGPFLDSIGDGTSGITLVTSTYNTVSHVTGLIGNVMLNKYSNRKVAIFGALLHFSGAVGTVFITKLGQLVFLYGIIEGIGFGFILPAALSAFNAYFDNKKMAFMMSICQTVVVVMFMVIPYIGTWCMNMYGFKGSILLQAGLSAFCIPAAMALRPVKWHLVKERMKEEELENVKETIQITQEKHQEVPLLNQEQGTEINKYKTKKVKTKQEKRQKIKMPLGERIGSLASINYDASDADTINESFWQSFLKHVDLRLLKDLKYLNISIGLSLSFTADVAFYPIIPSIMSNIGFSTSEIALMMSVYFGSDLAARIILSAISAFYSVRARYYVLGAAISGCIFRIVLFFNDSLQWKLLILAVLGFSRCFIQTPQALVISEDYSEDFASAYSLYMAINGVVCLIIGQFVGLIKFATHSDQWACHVLTFAFFANIICWSIEMFTCRKTKTTNTCEST